jgi:cyclic pyranopterin phosphate synthase
MTDGSQPTDLLKRPLGTLRISVTDRCNLRCQYCLPAELFGPDFAFLPRQEILSYEEISRLASVFIGLGVRRIRITGGEPLLRKDLPVLISQLRQLNPELDLSLTTNGGRLGDLAASLKEAGLDRINVSMDAVDPDIASRLASCQVDPERTWRNVLFARDLGLSPKVNTVLKRSVNRDQVLPMAGRCREAGIPLRFIEYMDVGRSNDWNTEEVVTGPEVLEELAAVWPVEPVSGQSLRETARLFRYRDGLSEVGFINSVSEPFCRGCDRARISADGMLYTCLFAEKGVSLKEMLREQQLDEPALRERIARLWRAPCGPLLGGAHTGIRRTSRHSPGNVDHRGLSDDPPPAACIPSGSPSCMPWPALEGAVPTSPFWPSAGCRSPPFRFWP